MLVCSPIAPLAKAMAGVHQMRAQVTRMATTHDLLMMLGECGFAALVERWGGGMLSIPKTITADHPIAQVVGLAGALQLSAAYSPGYIEVPTGKLWMQQKRRAEIIRRFKAGETISGICRDLKVTRWMVRQILDRPEAPPPGARRPCSTLQLDMFDDGLLDRRANSDGR